jgi:hypothetical protein
VPGRITVRLDDAVRSTRNVLCGSCPLSRKHVTSSDKLEAPDWLKISGSCSPDLSATKGVASSNRSPQNRCSELGRTYESNWFTNKSSFCSLPFLTFVALRLVVKVVPLDIRRNGTATLSVPGLQDGVASCRSSRAVEGDMFPTPIEVSSNGGTPSNARCH